VDQASPDGKRSIAFWRWPLIAIRITMLALTLTVCLPLYYLCACFTRRNPVPRLFLTLVTSIVGVRWRTIGERPAQSSFILANHVSWIDIPAIAAATGSAFVAHDGLADFAPLRWLCSLNDTVFVARHDRRSVAAQVGKVREALRDVGTLTVFPEGTTSDGSRLLAFKSSLLSALEADADHVPVQPLWLEYADVQDIAWAGAEPGIDNALKILGRLRRVRLTLHVLPQLRAEQRANRKTIAAAAAEAIGSAMNAAQRVAL